MACAKLVFLLLLHSPCHQCQPCPAVSWQGKASTKIRLLSLSLIPTHNNFIQGCTQYRSNGILGITYDINTKVYNLPIATSRTSHGALPSGNFLYINKPYMCVLDLLAPTPCLYYWIPINGLRPNLIGLKLSIFITSQLITILDFVRSSFWPLDQPWLIINFNTKRIKKSKILFPFLQYRTTQSKIQTQPKLYFG